MASKVVAIAQGQPALQLGLTGLRVVEAQSVEEVEKQLAELMESDAQVVIVDERYRDQFSEWFSLRLARHSGLPLIIFVPSFEEEDAGTDAYINAILKPAVGFEIRLD
jgi:vacuolar-type H+-ATPase subunit F/Vma7